MFWTFVAEDACNMKGEVCQAYLRSAFPRLKYLHTDLNLTFS
jgi:hypothetical protein